jgi:anti-sigma regulatory factor (Ser/Thr protein kinase)
MKDISLHILDIVHNSVRAKASEIKVSIAEHREKGIYRLTIEDNGTGIAPEALPNVADAFTTSRKNRKVGMGLALLKQNAELAGGSFGITSEQGKGTVVTAHFGHQHIDRPPPGDITGVVVQLAAAFPDTRFVYTHKTPTGEFIFDTNEIKEVLGDVPISNSEVRSYLKEMIEENLNEIGAEK